MSTTEKVCNTSNVSAQVTKVMKFSTKLEWRIENFENVIRLYQNGQALSSKTFITPHLQAMWQLEVYPTYYRNSYIFSLRFIGFQAPDGYLSTYGLLRWFGPKSIMAAYKIYLLGSKNAKEMVSQSSHVFNTGTAEASNGTHVYIHPDGSLLVICEIDCKASEETFVLEPSPNPVMLNQNVHLTDHIGKMWKSKLFADCTLKVGTESFPVHECILGQWSEVFCRMFSLPTEEAESGVVEITDFSPEAISAMLEYMYTGLVKNDVMEKLALELLPLADKYAVIPLKYMCEVFLASKLTTTNVLERAMFAVRYSAAKLKKACVNHFAIGEQYLNQKSGKI